MAHAKDVDAPLVQSLGVHLPMRWAAVAGRKSDAGAAGVGWLLRHGAALAPADIVNGRAGDEGDQASGGNSAVKKMMTRPLARSRLAAFE